MLNQTLSVALLLEGHSTRIPTCSFCNASKTWIAQVWQRDLNLEEGLQATTFSVARLILIQVFWSPPVRYLQHPTWILEHRIKLLKRCCQTCKNWTVRTNSCREVCKKCLSTTICLISRANRCHQWALNAQTLCPVDRKHKHFWIRHKTHNRLTCSKTTPISLDCIATRSSHSSSNSPSLCRSTSSNS